MKIKFLLLIMIVLALTLTACSSSTQTSDLASMQSGTLQPGMMGELSGLTRYLYGILMMEDTEDLAITSEQAAEMLPYWKAAKVLSESDNVSTEEMNGLTEQIQDVFTEQQKTFIETMDISFESMQSIMESLDITLSPGSGQPEDSQFNPGMEPPEGFVRPEGGGMGQNPGGGQTGTGLSPEQIETMQARRAEGGARVQLNPALVEALITLLEEKTAP